MQGMDLENKWYRYVLVGHRMFLALDMALPFYGQQAHPHTSRTTLHVSVTSKNGWFNIPVHVLHPGYHLE